MIIPLIFFIIAFIVGFSIAPIYFKLHQLLKLKSVPLENKWVHMHHSFYGLLLAIAGISSAFHYEAAIILLPIGLGLIMHHELTEPGLMGIQKFVDIRVFNKKK
jgi:hypothetical protein